jgi:hypothetical protein
MNTFEPLYSFLLMYVQDPHATVSIGCVSCRFVPDRKAADGMVADILMLFTLGNQTNDWTRWWSGCKTADELYF